MTLSLVRANGSYGGNSGTQSFVLGFQPAAIWIVNDRTTGTTANRAACLKLAPMSGASYMSNNANSVFKTTNGITITSTGFSVGSNADINASGSTYYWTALKAGPWLDTGTYSGNGGSQSILLNRQPIFVTIAEDGSTDSSIWKNSLVAGATAMRKTGAVASSSMLTLASTGFSASAEASTSGSTYYYLAVYRVVGATQHFQVGSYTGNAGALSVALGFQPSSLIVSDPSTVTYKFPSMAGASCGVLTGTHSWETANGLTLTATGFNVGNLSAVNSNAVVYNYLASRY